MRAIRRAASGQDSVQPIDNSKQDSLAVRGRVIDARDQTMVVKLRPQRRVIDEGDQRCLQVGCAQVRGGGDDFVDDRYDQAQHEVHQNETDRHVYGCIETHCPPPGRLLWQAPCLTRSAASPPRPTAVLSRGNASGIGEERRSGAPWSAVHDPQAIAFCPTRPGSKYPNSAIFNGYLDAADGPPPPPA